MTIMKKIKLQVALPLLRFQIRVSCCDGEEWKGEKLIYGYVVERKLKQLSLLEDFKIGGLMKERPWSTQIKFVPPSTSLSIM